MTIQAFEKASLVTLDDRDLACDSFHMESAAVIVTSFFSFFSIVTLLEKHVTRYGVGWGVCVWCVWDVDSSEDHLSMSMNG